MKNLTIVTDDRQLMKWLRFAGISAEILSDESGRNPNSVDLWYAFRSPSHYFSFPSDYKLYTGEFPLKKKIEILRRYLPLHKYLNLFSRCSECNGILKKVSKAEVESQLPPLVKTYATSFYRCTQCQHLYWDGTHYQKIHQKIMEVFHN